MNDERKLFYDNYVSGFKNFISPENEYDRKSFSKHLQVKLLPYLSKYKFDAKILELGCGPGHTLEFLRERGFKNLKGIDISQEQVEKAIKKNLDVELKDVFDFVNNHEQKYDIIIAFDFIEHFKKEEVQKLFEAVTNKFNINGLLIIRTPNGQGLFPNQIIYGDLTHYTIFNPNSLTQILRLNGFSKIDFLENAPIAKNIRGAVRLALWKLVKLVYNFIRIVEKGSTENIITQDFYCFARKEEREK